MSKSDLDLTYDDLEIGTVLCDMHYGFRGLSQHIKVVNHFSVENECSTSAMRALLRGCELSDAYTNKMLIVIGWRENHEAVAAYSCDGHRLGFVVIAPKQEMTDA